MRGQYGCGDTWWGESTPLPAAALSTTMEGGRFSLWLQITKILMSASTDLLNSHQVTLGIVFTLLIGSNLAMAPRLPIYAVAATQAAYEALLVLNVWTSALGTVTAYVDDETNATPAYIWYCGVLILPPLWYKGRLAGWAELCSWRRKNQVAPSPPTSHKGSAKQRERTASGLPQLKTAKTSPAQPAKQRERTTSRLPPLKTAKTNAQTYGQSQARKKP